MQRAFISKPFKKIKFKQKYYSDATLVKEVFAAFEQLEDGNITLKMIIEQSQIPKDTIYYWHRKWEKNHEYRPGINFGKHLKLFDEKQERAVADFLRIQYIIPGVLVRRKHVRRIIMDLWRSFNPNSTKKARDVVSYHFVRDFCKRQKLSFRKPRGKKRADISQEEVEEYALIYKEVFSSVPWNRILNMDETPLNYVSNRTEVLAECGTEQVNAQLPIDPKANFTILATISMNGDKLPPVFLAQGKTHVCHQQFDGIDSSEPYEILHSPGGFTNEEVMIQYLQLVKKWMNNQHTVLILDRYPAHMTQNVREEAQRNNIRLVYIPTSATDLYQSLDRRIFGAVKSTYSSKSDDNLFDFDTGPSKAKAAETFLSCWQELNRATVLSAWDLEDDQSEDDDSDPFSPTSYEEDYSPSDDLVDEPPIQEEKEQPITPPRRWLK